MKVMDISKWSGRKKAVTKNVSKPKEEDANTGLAGRPAGTIPKRRDKGGPGSPGKS